MNIGIYERTCKGLCEMVPQKKREKMIFKSMDYAGVKGDYDVWLGKRILLSILMGIVGFILPWTIGKYFSFFDFTSGAEIFIGESAYVIPFLPILISLALGLFFMIATIVVFYIHLYYQIENRTSLVEAVLPDFLQLVASNVSAGMTPFASFRSAARKEFGPLSEEIRIATTKSLGTQSFTQALKELSKRIKSRQLEETIAFFGQSLRSGGKLAQLLETSADYLRRVQEMKKELQSNTKMYTLFVFFVILVATPVLLAVSMQFLTMITNIQAESNYDTGDTGAVAFLSSDMSISPDFMFNLSIVYLFLNSILSGLFVGVLESGKAKNGISKIPILLVVSITIFLFAVQFLGAFLGV